MVNLLNGFKHTRVASLKYSRAPRNADIDIKDSENSTPLIIAARNGHVETAAILLKNKADINEVDRDEKTCMMWAAEENRVEVIKVGAGNWASWGVLF